EPAPQSGASTTMAVAEPYTGRAGTPAVGSDHRVRVEGRLLARAGRRFRVQGVTYGPFRSNGAGEPFPDANRVAEDFALMRGVGINSVRTYHVPPEWLLRVADEEGMAVFIDVPWAKHVCFLESDRAQSEARQTVRLA